MTDTATDTALASSPSSPPQPGSGAMFDRIARRYDLPTGERFHGFVPASADKLFHSTDVRVRS